eukprot:7680818-Pyramimonas_sp.AAC.1
MRPNRSTWITAQPARANSGISIWNALPSVNNGPCSNPSAGRLTHEIKSAGSTRGSRGAGEGKTPRANLSAPSTLHSRTRAARSRWRAPTRSRRNCWCAGHS